MHRFLIYVLCIASLASCSSKNPNEVPFFNGLAFELRSGEVITEIDHMIEKEYRTHLDSASVEIPLYRCIQGEDYFIFIGLPINTTVADIAKAQGGVVNADGYHFLQKKMGTQHQSILAKTFDDNKVYIATISPQPVDSLFGEQALLDRFTR